MNILLSSSGSTPSKILPLGLVMAGLILTACSTATKAKKDEINWKERSTSSAVPDAGVDILIKNMLQRNGEEIAELIAQKIESDPTFHSLAAIKKFIEEELKKRGINSMIVSAQLLPFTPTTDGQYTYLSVDVKTAMPRGGINFSLETADRENVVPVLTAMLDNFEKQTAQKALEAFVCGIAENGGAMEVNSLAQKIKTVLESDKHIFLQHGFNLQWVKIGQDNETREVKIYLELHDIPNGAIIHMPIPTWITPEKEEDTERRRGRSIKGETMLAQSVAA